jgi:uncharacterized protein (TIRG00374 family)
MSDALLPQLGRRHIVQGLLGISGAIALLFVCLHRTEPANLIKSFGALTLSAALPALLCEISVQLSKALKWQAILSRVQKVRYSSTLSAVVVGAASTHLLPLRLDEIVRSALLARREGISPGTVLGTVAIDRIIELLVAGTVLLAAALVLDLPGWMVTCCWFLGAILGIAVLATLFLLKSEESIARWLHSSRFSAGPWLARGLGSVNLGLRSLPQGRAMLFVIVGAAGEWVATILFYLWMLHVFGIVCGGEVPLIMAIGNSVAYMVPNVPGALGMYEGVQSGILEGLAAVEPSKALAVAFASHAILMIPVTVTGLLVGIWEFRSTNEDRAPTVAPAAKEKD